ncbi:hypothetical protein V6Z11_A11G282900 [Gossypium hirsutum]
MKSLSNIGSNRWQNWSLLIGSRTYDLGVYSLLLNRNVIFPFLLMAYQIEAMEY